MLTEIALKAKAMWRCPGNRSCDPPREELDAKCAQDLVAVQRLTGVSGLRTCPNWYASLPWVVRANRVRLWRNHGALSAITQSISHEMLTAIDAIDQGVAERTVFEADQRREEAERRAAEMKARQQNHG